MKILKIPKGATVFRIQELEDLRGLEDPEALEECAHLHVHEDLEDLLGRQHLEELQVRQDLVDLQDLRT